MYILLYIYIYIILSREVSTNVGLFTGIDPISLPEYCAAVRFRFAFSERRYLFDLCSRVRVRILDCLPLVELTDFFLPKGSISSHCILTNLLQALHFEGIHARIPACVSDTDNWILNVSLPNSIIDIPSQFKGIQSACLHFLISTSLYQNQSRISNFQSYLGSNLQDNIYT